MDKSIGSNIVYMPSLIRNHDATVACLNLAGRLFMRGQVVDFNHINNSGERKHVSDLVTFIKPYPWSRRKYWAESRISRMHRLKPFARHDLLGTLTDYSSELEPTWRNILSTQSVPWLRDYKILGITSFPLTGFVSMAVEAAAQVAMMREREANQFVLEDVRIREPLHLDDDKEYEMLVAVIPVGDASIVDLGAEFRISSYEQQRGWIDHCRGRIKIKHVSDPPLSRRQPDEEPWIAVQENHTAITAASFYNDMSRAGVDYGRTFKNIAEIWADSTHALAVSATPDTKSAMPFGYETPYIVHPCILEGAIQSCRSVVRASGIGMDGAVADSIQEIHINNDYLRAMNDKLVFTSKRNGISSATPKLSVEAHTSLGLYGPSCITIVGLEFKQIKLVQTNPGKPRALCYSLEWKRYEILVSGATDQSNDMANGNELPLPSFKKTKVNGQSNLKPHHTEYSETVIISDRTEKDPFVETLMNQLFHKQGRQPRLSSLGDFDLQGRSCIVISELDKPLLSSTSADTFGEIQQALLHSSAVLWVTAGAFKTATNPDANLSQGLMRTLRSEMASKVATLDLNPNSTFTIADQAKLVMQAFESCIAGDHSGLDMEFAEEDGVLVVPRFVEDDKMNLLLHREMHPSIPYLQSLSQRDRHLKLAAGTPGDLDSLYFRDDEVLPLGAEDIEIKVAATGVTADDVDVAMGRILKSQVRQGCSGTVTRVGSKVHNVCVGDIVCALVSEGYGTFASCPASSAAKLPEGIMLSDSPTIPIAFCSSYYGIVHAARLCSSDKILIDAGTEFEQAAIQIAGLFGAEIFVAVSNSLQAKKKINTTYGIPEDHIFDRNDPFLSTSVCKVTEGQGMDVVLCYDGAEPRKLLQCLSEFGRFVKISRKETSKSSVSGLGSAPNNATLCCVNIDSVAEKRPVVMAEIFNCIVELFVSKTLKMVEVPRTFGLSNIGEAFSMVEDGLAVSNPVIVPGASDIVKAVHPKAKSMFYADATYVIVGGTGRIGLSIATWMANTGAMNIVLLSRRGNVHREHNAFIETLQSAGVRILVKVCDITDADGVKSVIEDCSKTLPPIKGLIHSAMVLRDNLFEKVSFEDFQAVLQPKVAGTWNIHTALADTRLDFFIALSSASGIIGSRGQAAYAAANTFLDAFVQYRLRLGLPAAVIDLTAVSGYGQVHESVERQELICRNFNETINEDEVLALLATAIKCSSTTNSSHHYVTGLNLGSDPERRLPYYAKDAKFSILLDAAMAASPAGVDLPQQSLSIGQILKSSGGFEAASEIVSNRLLVKLSEVLGTPVSSMDATQLITSYGLDSLNAIELRNWIANELEINFQILELLTAGAVRDLASLIVKKASTGMELSH